VGGLNLTPCLVNPLINLIPIFEPCVTFVVNPNPNSSIQQ
jgi:hypothetical protein